MGGNNYSRQRAGDDGGSELMNLMTTLGVYVMVLFFIFVCVCYLRSCVQECCCGLEEISVNSREGVVLRQPLPHADLRTPPRQEPLTVISAAGAQFFKDSTQDRPKELLGEQLKTVASGSKAFEEKALPLTTSVEEDSVGNPVQESSRPCANQGHYSSPSSTMAIDVSALPQSNYVNFAESPPRQQIPLFLASKLPTTTPYTPVYNPLLKGNSSSKISQTSQSSPTNFPPHECGIMSPSYAPTPKKILNASVPSTNSSRVLNVPCDISVPSSTAGSFSTLNIPINTSEQSRTSSPTLYTFHDPTVPSINSADALNIHFHLSNPSTSFSSAHNVSQQHASRLLFYRNCKVDLQDIGVVDATHHSEPTPSPEPQALHNEHFALCSECCRRGDLDNHHSSDEDSDGPDFVDAEGFPKV